MKKGYRLITSILISLFFLLSTTTYNLQPIYAISPGTEEVGVYNQNFLLPNPVATASTPANPNIFQQFFDSLGNLLGNLFSGQFFQPISDPLKMFAQTENLHQSYLPEELKPSEGTPTSQIQTLIQDNYNKDMPKEVRGENIQDSEKYYEEAHFPPGIHPLTGQL